MIIQHNMSAMNNINIGKKLSMDMAKITEKLSSGYKINRAADDAANLAISEKMNAWIDAHTEEMVALLQDFARIPSVSRADLAEENAPFGADCRKMLDYALMRSREMGFETIAAGDSYNDLSMIRASKAGFLFKSTDKIKADNPDLPAFEDYDDLLNAIKAAL